MPSLAHLDRVLIQYRFYFLQLYGPVILSLQCCHRTCSLLHIYYVNPLFLSHLTQPCGSYVHYTNGKPRLREFSNLFRVSELLNDGCFFKLRSIWFQSQCSSQLYLVYSHLSLPINTYFPFPNSWLLFTNSGVNLTATGPFTLNTFTSGFCPLTCYLSSSLTIQTLLSFQKPFSTRSLTSPLAHSSQCELPQFGFCEHKLVWGMSFPELFSKQTIIQSHSHYKFSYFSFP